MPDYNIRVFQLNHYLKIYMPDLFYTFKKNQINPDIIFSKWILTIFSSYLSFGTLAKVWDVFLVDNWKGIIKYSLVFLKDVYDILITKDLPGISTYFRENYRLLHNNLNRLYRLYNDFKVSLILNFR